MDSVGVLPYPFGPPWRPHQLKRRVPIHSDGFPSQTPVFLWPQKHSWPVCQEDDDQEQLPTTEEERLVGGSLGPHLSVGQSGGALCLYFRASPADRAPPAHSSPDSERSLC